MLSHQQFLVSTCSADFVRDSLAEESIVAVADVAIIVLLMSDSLSSSRFCFVLGDMLHKAKSPSSSPV